MVAKALRLWQTLRRGYEPGAVFPGPWLLLAQLAAVLSLFFALGMADPAFFRIVTSSIADAYMQVSVFVAATLLLFYILERSFRLDTASLMTRYRAWQVPLAAFLGALPGCGGAIIVITQYITGRVRFGSMVAVLIATMGDAAFLLLAREPLTGLAVFLLGLIVGTISGYVVDMLHDADFLRPKTAAPGFVNTDQDRPLCDSFLRRVWMVVLGPGIVLGIASAAQIDTDAFFGPLAVYGPTTVIGFAGGLLSILMWLDQPGPAMGVAAAVRPGDPISHRVIADTNFVTVWVIGGFLAYEGLVYFTDFDLKSYFQTVAALAPLMGVIVGFLPGCGPQLVVTTLYLNGVVPLSAQLGNAVSNDGDALFPAIALAPGAAIVATLYSAVPALLVGYGWFFLFE